MLTEEQPGPSKKRVRMESDFNNSYCGLDEREVRHINGLLENNDIFGSDSDEEPFIDSGRQYLLSENDMGHQESDESEMPRKRLRKTERARSDISKYKHAYEEVKGGTSLRRAAEMHDVNRMSLLRYIRKRDEAGPNHDEDSISMGEQRAKTHLMKVKIPKEKCKKLIWYLDPSVKSYQICLLIILALKINEHESEYEEVYSGVVSPDGSVSVAAVPILSNNEKRPHSLMSILGTSTPTLKNSKKKKSDDSQLYLFGIYFLSTFLNAKGHLGEAEFTDRIGDEINEEVTDVRKRKQKRVILPGEEDNSDTNEATELVKKKKEQTKTNINHSKQLLYPPPPQPASPTSSIFELSSIESEGIQEVRRSLSEESVFSQAGTVTSNNASDSDSVITDSDDSIIDKNYYPSSDDSDDDEFDDNLDKISSMPTSSNSSVSTLQENVGSISDDAEVNSWRTITQSDPILPTLAKPNLQIHVKGVPNDPVVRVVQQRFLGEEFLETDLGGEG
ncbi:hypothetical protein RN001_003634 [Aquatica leii]|uniref:Uncharacterized protein n=1 Tax=Aquatica leii TaxID=1421715 RepID=A0AAN7PIU7_9COLE|nr:hypothetical protein RN001_003634 [Aquatica leii]